MDAFLWAALGFLVVATMGGGVFVGLHAWRAWDAFVSLAAAGGAAAEWLLGRAEAVAVRGEHVGARAEDLLTAVERLERSLARARVLMGAVEEALDLLRAARLVVPRK
jgi:hypothetical protein